MSSGIAGQSVTKNTNETVDKGKGKAAQPIEDTEDETSDDGEEMCEDIGEEEDDELAEIDPSNIITSGRRTRGKQIDFTKADAEQPAPEEDSEDDEDFVAKEEGEKSDVEMQT